MPDREGGGGAVRGGRIPMRSQRGRDRHEGQNFSRILAIHSLSASSSERA